MGNSYRFMRVTLFFYNDMVGIFYVNIRVILIFFCSSKVGNFYANLWCFVNAFFITTWCRGIFGSEFMG